jgi:hypothetical protein
MNPTSWKTKAKSSVSFASKNRQTPSTSAGSEFAKATGEKAMEKNS